ncbi:unnamed protein product [Spirodela intermedia]|uniref:Uncharacterized protein n=1 Tax=Spirodela intermedia TaxID=51605 RepID=A0A7I8J246_SPIIN|nr:unnamed protein product [Spirodela intermedia]CAA6664295.1 unnamed protein product [Spirodela intermedia]
MGKQDAMSKKLESWLGRSFKATKLRSYLGITITRLSVHPQPATGQVGAGPLRRRRVLRQGKHERALLRTDHIIKEQNMLDAFDMVESYCHILSERADLLESHRECPEELREAISSLVFADSRCGQLPELHEVRSILASRLGKEFVSSAVELRNSCGVNPTIIQKLSTKQPTIEMKWKVVKDMAAELGIDLPLQEPSPEIPTVR